MRVFVTGASGFIGSKIVRELLSSGHTVVGLARSDESAAAITAAGAKVHRGSLEDLESLRSGAAAADGVIHCGFVHNFSDYAGMCRTDRHAIDAIGSVLIGSNKPFVITSGTALLTSDRLTTEADAYENAGFKAERGQSETLALAFASKGVRVSVIRLPPSVHDEGDRGFVPMLIDIARKKGVSAYVDAGTNVWPSVHRLDAAHLFCLALEKAPAGSVLHGVADEAIPMKDIASVIGKRLSIPVVSKSKAESKEHFGWIADFIALNNPTSSAITRQKIGWTPTHTSLLDDIDHDYYFSDQSK